jgi:hypothetical protein
LIDTGSFFPAISKGALSIDATTAQGITPEDAAGVLMQKGKFTVEGSNIRYWETGDIPTATEGHFIGTQNQFEIFGHENLLRLKMIATAGTATVSYTLYAS